MPVIMRYKADKFKRKLDFSNVLIDYTVQKIKKNKNMLMNISGGTGEGKSIATLYLGQRIQRITNPTLPFTINQIVFRSTDFMRLIMGENALPSGSVIIWDEIGVGLNAKKSMSALNIALNNTFQVFRSKRYIVISSTPDFNFIDKSTRKLLHCHLETKGINYKYNINKIACQLMQFNPKLGKIYYHNFRLAVEGQPFRQLKNIYTGFPTGKIVKEYEEKKERYNQRIFKQTMKTLQKHDNMAPLTPKQETIYKMNQEGLTQNEIADSLGLDQQVIAKHLKAIENKSYEILRYGGFKKYKVAN